MTVKERLPKEGEEWHILNFSNTKLTETRNVTPEFVQDFNEYIVNAEEKVLIVVFQIIDDDGREHSCYIVRTKVDKIFFYIVFLKSPENVISVLRILSQVIPDNEAIIKIVMLLLNSMKDVSENYQMLKCDA